eukprot:54833_1
MLEKFKTIGNGDEYHFGVTLKSLALHMKAFEWKNIKIDRIDNNISSWKRLEYLKFEQCSFVHNIPNAFAKLKEMKYLSFRENGLNSFPESICNLTQLKVLELYAETQIISIPHCVSNLRELNQLVIDVCFNLKYIPLSIFSLPKLIVLTLFKDSITYQSLLEYNLPSNSMNWSTLRVSEWVNDNFNPHNYNQTEYWMSSNPICDEKTAQLPSKLQHFLNNTCDYFCEIDNKLTTLCSPLLYGNGRCDFLCNFAECGWDFGDCTQLCFANEISNCTYDKMMNDKCDKGCNNKYCSGYAYGSGVRSNFHIPIFRNRGLTTAADNFNCEVNMTSMDNKDFKVNLNITCEDSNSSYITKTFIKAADIEGLKCTSDWIEDSNCDDLCRTNECEQDLVDCELGCINNPCYQIYQAWNLLIVPIIDSNVYYINNTALCATVYPKAAQLFGFDPGDCEQHVDREDYNGDGVINFREFVPLAYVFAGGWRDKGAQVNCSECVGMDYYNLSP